MTMRYNIYEITTLHVHVKILHLFIGCGVNHARQKYVMYLVGCIHTLILNTLTSMGKALA